MGNVCLTRLFEDGTCYMQEVEVDALEDDYDGDLEEDDGPIVGREDPYFQMQSANEGHMQIHFM